MKYTIVTFLLFFVLLTNAQQDSSYVEVNYEMTMDLDPEEVINNMPKQFRAAYADQIRQELKDGIKMNYVLKTNGKESTFQLLERINNAQSAAGIITQQIMSQDKGVFYKNLDNESFVKAYDIMGTKYLINDSLPDYTWTISRDKEQIGEFETRKAVGQYNDTIFVNAWYAPKLTFKDGPDRAWGLPGLILKSEFETNGSKITLRATSVAVKNDEFKIKKPSAKKEWTQEEFDAEMKRIQEEFRKNMSQGVDTD